MSPTEGSTPAYVNRVSADNYVSCRQAALNAAANIVSMAPLVRFCTIRYKFNVRKCNVEMLLLSSILAVIRQEMCNTEASLYRWFLFMSA